MKVHLEDAHKKVTYFIGPRKTMPGRKEGPGGTWLAQSVKHVTLDLRVVRLSPKLGVEIT